MTETARKRIAVALHDVEPATFERCALIRDRLDDHGVGRVTMLVIPARDLHPLAERSPEMVSWLIERERRGDTIAQHGFQHLRSQGAGRARLRKPTGPPHASCWRRRSGCQAAEACALTPALLRAGALVSGTTLCLDLHPADLDHPRHMLALEWVLTRSHGTREAVTCEQMALTSAAPEIEQGASPNTTFAH